MNLKVFNNNKQSPNITNINIINYNTINENFVQINLQNDITNNKNINEKIKNNINALISKKVENNNKLELNKKENSVNNKENNENQNNNINIIDNAYKSFYKKNKDKDIYNIKLNLGDNSSDSNSIMNNNFNYNVINEEEEFAQNEKMKISQIAAFYKKHGNDEKNNSKIKYLQKISPSKNYYYNKNLLNSKNNFQLPVIFKGVGFNNHVMHNHKKYNNFY